MRHYREMRRYWRELNRIKEYRNEQIKTETISTVNAAHENSRDIIHPPLSRWEFHDGKYTILCYIVKIRE